jgi:hypothetical protein
MTRRTLVCMAAALGLLAAPGCNKLKALTATDAGTTTAEPVPSTSSSTLPNTPPPSMEAPAPAETAAATDDASAPGDKPGGPVVEGTVPSDEEAQQKATTDIGRDNYKTELDELEKELTH